MSLEVFPNQTVEECSSTNDLAKILVESQYPHGTWVSARVQTAGRGRQGRVWKSIEGNLYLSIIVQVPEKSLWSWIPLTTAIGVVRFVKDSFPSLDLQVKWPNDLILNQKKLGGILCEGGGRNSPHSIVIGIGLNCLSAPENLDQEAIDLTSALNGNRVSADQIRLPIVNSILREVQCLLCEGTGPIQHSYEAWANFRRNTEVQWGQPPQSGWVKGLGPSAELQIQAVSGQTISLFAEDVQRRNLMRSYSTSKR
jgi:BirA family transcriptional regulator, biotin operon repressor / biotin---[acetyl-CoA-carboxylase] ligase